MRAKNPTGAAMKRSHFVCQECGRALTTSTLMLRAMLRGCPHCGALDLDLPDEAELSYLEDVFPTTFAPADHPYGR